MRHVDINSISLCGWMLFKYCTNGPEQFGTIINHISVRILWSKIHCRCTSSLQIKPNSVLWVLCGSIIHHWNGKFYVTKKWAACMKERGRRGKEELGYPWEWKVLWIPTAWIRTADGQNVGAKCKTVHSLLKKIELKWKEMTTKCNMIASLQNTEGTWIFFLLSHPTCRKTGIFFHFFIYEN